MYPRPGTRQFAALDAIDKQIARRYWNENGDDDEPRTQDGETTMSDPREVCPDPEWKSGEGYDEYLDSLVGDPEDEPEDTVSALLREVARLRAENAELRKAVDR